LGVAEYTLNGLIVWFYR